VIRRTGKPFDCPVCGEEVPANAQACPECGACDRAGWSEDLASSGLDLPDEDFDYEKFVAEEFEGGAKKSPAQWMWWTAGIILILIVLVFLLSSSW
jgi:hypothetical protein